MRPFLLDAHAGGWLARTVQVRQGSRIHSGPIDHVGVAVAARRDRWMYQEPVYGRNIPIGSATHGSSQYRNVCKFHSPSYGPLDARSGLQ
jgi:hypothetical protein